MGEKFDPLIYNFQWFVYLFVFVIVRILLIWAVW